jgi:hypothetical protein
VLLSRWDIDTGRINRHDAPARRQIRHVEELKINLAVERFLFGMGEIYAGRNDLVVTADAGDGPTAICGRKLRAAIALRA